MNEVWIGLSPSEGRRYAACYAVPQRIVAERDTDIAIAPTDSLTRLPGRSLILDRLDQALRQARRKRNAVAVMFVDLDHFKDINDTYGHLAGDHVLCESARRIEKCVRDSDVLARVGGDEFSILLPDPGPARDIARVADRILGAFADPIELLDGRFIYMTCSIGIACWPNDGSDADTLIHHANLALYAAKGGGRNRRVFFDQGMREAVEQRIALEHDLRRAVAERAFELHFQPVFEKGVGVTEVEALVRFRGGDGKHLPPPVFLGVAEEIGLGPAIGKLVLQKACRQMAAWRQGGVDHIRISVNVSRRQVEADDFVETLTAALRDNDLPASTLVIEVHESIVMAESAKVESALRDVAELGVTVAIDDFGSGYSSLKRMMNLPLATLKINRTFINDLVEGRNGPAMIELISLIADELGMEIVAEGVETETQADLLTDIACTRHQGFLYGRPVAADELNQVLFGKGLEHALEDAGSPGEPESHGLGLRLVRMLQKRIRKINAELG